MNKNTIVIIIILFGSVVAVFYLYKISNFYKPIPSLIPETLENNGFEVVTENLNIPWEIAFLPDGDLLVTERPGTVRRISNKKIYNIEGVEHAGEGGLLGMALHPQFDQNRWVYLYLTAKNGENLINRVERYHFDNDQFSYKKIIIDNIPGAAYHDGGRIAFGPDGYLYITTGDAGRPNLAQDINSLVGKILRLKDDGSFPSDNPFGNVVYSYGHRNPQGIAFDDQKRLWETEHGPSSLLWPNCCQDEINLIEKGKNYGWPDSVGDRVRSSTVAPALHSGIDTWAPASVAYFSGSLFFGGLKGEALYEATLVGKQVAEIKEHFKGEFGRIRTVVLGPDGYIYFTTSNTDGRGEPKEKDDKIIRININNLGR